MRSGPPKIVGEKTADMAHTFARKIAVQIADYKVCTLPYYRQLQCLSR